MNRTVESGPNPKEGRVEQYTAVVGAFTADAKCMGAESFTKFMRAPFCSAADCKKLSLPARFTTDVCVAVVRM